MDLVAALRIVRRRWAFVAALVLLGLFAALSSWVLRGEEATLYRADHLLAVPGGGSVNLNQAAEIVRTVEVPERVAATLGGEPAALAAQIRSSVREDVGFLEVTALGIDPERTKVLADTFAAELVIYMEEITQQQRRSELESLEEEIAELRLSLLGLMNEPPSDPTQEMVRAQQVEQITAQVATLETSRNQVQTQLERSSTLVSVSEAEPLPISGPEFRTLFASDSSRNALADDAGAALATSPIGLMPRLAIGGLGGLLLGIAAAFIVDRLDPRLRLKQDVEAIYGWPVLTEIPPLDRHQQQEHVILAHDAPRSRTAEAYRVLRSSLLFVASERMSVDEETKPRPTADGNVLLVTSASPAEGKTTTVANLAAVMGEAGQRVLVINCDFRRPTLGSYMGVADAPARVIDTPYPQVSLLAQVRDGAATANPAEVVELQRQVIDEARRRFDWVLLDSAPILTTNDANEVLASTDFVLVVARAGRTTREAADRCAEALERRNASVLGVVLVAATEAPSARYYYYGDYYFAGDKADKADKARSAPANGDGTAPPGDKQSRGDSSSTDEGSSDDLSNDPAPRPDDDDDDTSDAPVILPDVDDQASSREGGSDEPRDGDSDGAVVVSDQMDELGIVVSAERAGSGTATRDDGPGVRES